MRAGFCGGGFVAVCEGAQCMQVFVRGFVAIYEDAQCMWVRGCEFVAVCESVQCLRVFVGECLRP